MSQPSDPKKPPVGADETVQMGSAPLNPTTAAENADVTQYVSSGKPTRPNIDQTAAFHQSDHNAPTVMATITTGAVNKPNPMPVDVTIATGSAHAGPGSIDETIATGSSLTGERFDSTLMGGSGVISNAETINATVAGGSTPTTPVGSATRAVQSKDGLSIGDYFQKRYRIIKLLGAGGMGKVYQAHHEGLDKMVAIKFLIGNMNEDAEAIARFQREAQATAKVSHPNAVQVIDTGVEDGICYIVMEFLEGESLRERIFRRGRIPLAETVHFAEKVCYVLEYMHRKGITHRDLKPDNIFYQIQEDMETIKVLDFGIAKVHATATHAGSDLTREGMMIGTPRYMSPEQCQGQGVDGRSDLYSLAVVVFEMLSGQVPYDADNPFSVALKQINSPIPKLSEVAPHIPEAVSDVIYKAMAKAPKDRYASVKDFAQALVQAANLQSTVHMELLAGSAPVDYSKMETSESKGNKTAGGTLPLSKMGGPTKAFGSEGPADAQKKPWLVYAVIAFLVIGGGGVGGVIWNQKVQEEKRLQAEADRLRKEEEAKKAAENSPLKEFVLIPGGTFKMGSNQADFDKDNNPIAPDEVPAHEVTVKPFYLCKYEVSNAEYYEFIKATGYKAPDGWKDGKFGPGEDKYPVVNVSWNDATAYCEWRAKKDGVPFRLPTEEEWEFAARGTDGRFYPWGNQWNADRTNSNKDKEATSSLETNSSSPKIKDDLSPYGIIALAGNVSEWTTSDLTIYSGSTYKLKPGDQGCKIFRGGAFSITQAYSRTTSRNWGKPDTKARFIGFRLAGNANPS